MTYSLTLTNPPNPTSVHAGNDADETFFDSLCETLNGTHASGSLNIFNQGYRDDLFRKDGAGSNGSMTRHRAPVPSRAHTSLKVVFRGRHYQSGSSYGRLLVSVYDQAGSLLASSYSGLSSGSTDDIGTATITGLTLTEDHVRIRCGLVASTAGSFSYCSSLAAAWVPLTSVATTKSDDGAIIPVGSNATEAGRPISAALGYALMTTSNTLLKRKRLLASMSGVSGTSETDVAYLQPFPYCQIARLNHTDQATRIYWWVLAYNSGGSAQDFAVAYGDTDSLFLHNHTEPNGFNIQARETQSVPASTTAWYNGYIDIPAPPPRGQGMHERLIFLACSTPAMSRRDAFYFNDHDASLLIRSVNFWSE